MKNLFLRNKNNKSVLLKCDDQFKPLVEMPIGQLRPRDKAFYVGVPDGYIGVYSSKNGPVLFINNDQYLFVDPIWKVSVKEGLVNNEVWFSNLMAHDLHFEYKKVELDPLDPWSEKQFDDFFIWLSSKRDNREFIDMWTEKN